MIPQKTFYPWMNDQLVNTTKHTRGDNLYAFLNGICLRHIYNVCKKKLHISEPGDFARFRVSDLQLVGLSELEVNRLVSRMLDLGLPTGNLLSTNEDEYERRSWSDALDRLPFSDSHRPKLLRRLFGKKHACHSSAPVSPAHYDYPLASGSRLGSRACTAGSATGFVPTQRSHSFIGAGSPGDDEQLTPTLTRSAHLGVGIEKRPDAARAPLTCLIPEQDIKLHSRIGVGSFGIVRRADWSTPSGEVLPVAVKLLRPEAMAGDCFTSFLDELRAMQCLSHPNLIRLHGVVLSNPIMMVTELAPLGSLLLHLRAQSVCASTAAGGGGAGGGATANSVDGTCSVPRALQIDSLWDMGVQIACGMAYLSSCGLVHRDLAARNILLASVRKGHFPQVKIGDFGLVRAVTYVERSLGKEEEQYLEGAEGDGSCSPATPDAVYMGRVEQRIPFAWSAPECLRDRQFSQASDVWSWGVTCWEIWTGGAAPWPGLDANKLLSVLESGRRLAWPRHSCPRRLYQFMLACWRAEPGRRPSFSYLAERLDKIRPFEVVARQNLDEADRLGLEAGDVIVVSDDRPHKFWWRGQNRRTGELGSFPRGIVQRDNKLSPVDISRPLANSFVHAGHVNRQSIDRSTHPDRRQRREISSGDRPCLTSLPCHDTASSTYTAAASALYDDETGCSRQTAAYLDALERLRREQTEGLWSPVTDLDSSSTREQLCLKRPGSEDGYSVCLSIDQLSINTPHSGNLSLINNNPIVLDQYEDDEDERFILDNTPHATVGFSSGPPRSRLNQVAQCDREGHAPLFYDASDYQSPIVLPAPPGPEEDLPPCTTSAHTRSISTPSCIAQGASRISTTHSTTTSSLFTPATVTAPSSFTASHRLDTRPSRSLYRRRGSHQSENEAQDPSAPPLIDLYSPIPPKPNPLFENPQFPVPTAPIYQFHLPYYFPIYKPTHVIRMGTPPVWPPFPPPNTEQSHSVASGPSCSIPVVRSASTTDPFDCSASVTAAFDLRTKIPDPPQKDPFELDDVSNNQNPTIDRLATPTPTATSKLSASVSPLGPTSAASRVERQLLVGSAAPTNPFYSELMQHAASESTSRSSQTEAPKCDPDRSFKSTSPNETPLFNSANPTATDVQLSIEIACVCAQVPGVSADEARQALAYLLNPFVSVIPHLLVPPLPSAPLYQSAASHMTELSANRVQLAVRLVCANRLHQLGLTSWELGCQLLSAFNWSVPYAADWLADRRNPGR